MRRTTFISVSQARSELSELIGRARYGNEIVMIERSGTPMAVLLGFQEFRACQFFHAAKEQQPVPFSLSSSLFDLVGLGAGEHPDISEQTDEFLAKAYSPEAND